MNYPILTVAILIPCAPAYGMWEFSESACPYHERHLVNFKTLQGNLTDGQRLARRAQEADTLTKQNTQVPLSRVNKLINRLDEAQRVLPAQQTFINGNLAQLNNPAQLATYKSSEAKKLILFGAGSGASVLELGRHILPASATKFMWFVAGDLFIHPVGTFLLWLALQAASKAWQSKKDSEIDKKTLEEQKVIYDKLAQELPTILQTLRQLSQNQQNGQTSTPPTT